MNCSRILRTFVLIFKNYMSKAICLNSLGRLIFTIQAILISPSLLAMDLHSLQSELGQYTDRKDARIGIAVIYDGQDSILVNGRCDFPMASVYKFPQALAVADYCIMNGLEVQDTVDIAACEIKENTWSPLRDKHGVADMRLSISDLLTFSLQQSDNNACDILFRLIGGTGAADSLMKAKGYADIVICSTEDEMHKDPDLCYKNRATPIAMAQLFDEFCRLGMRYDSMTHETIYSSMVSCQTGNNRIALPLQPIGAVICHKTGTGDTNQHGRIIAVNDAGYISLPDGHGYAIAVFISDSGYSLKETEQIIADISCIVSKHLSHRTDP